MVKREKSKISCYEDEYFGDTDPINEPKVSQESFVMNTATELMQAMRDYQMGKMG